MFGEKCSYCCKNSCHSRRDRGKDIVHIDSEEDEFKCSDESDEDFHFDRKEESTQANEEEYANFGNQEASRSENNDAIKAGMRFKCRVVQYSL